MPATRNTTFRFHRPWLFGLLLAAVTAALPACAQEAQERPVLQPWHTVILKNEFHAGDEARIKTIADYQALETTLFAELDERVYRAVDPREKSRINRYWAGSNSDPRTSTPDWSRTQVMPVANPRGGVLLVHGLSDSPYIMRGLAEYLHGQGWYVVALRLPGHGTAPSGLLEVKWQDWAAAVRLAAKDLVATVGAEKPLVLQSPACRGSTSLPGKMCCRSTTRTSTTASR